MDQKIRVIVAKPGLDGHDRGAKVVARAFRDAGFEVIYTGLRQTPEQIVNAALQEDADVVGLSVLSGAHMTLCPRITELMKKERLDDVLVVVGGIIPDQDIPKLKETGVRCFSTRRVHGRHHYLYPAKRAQEVSTQTETSANRAAMTELVAELRAKLERVKKGGGEAVVRRHKDRGKML